MEGASFEMSKLSQRYGCQYKEEQSPLVLLSEALRCRNVVNLFQAESNAVVSILSHLRMFSDYLKSSLPVLCIVHQHRFFEVGEL